MRVDFGTLFLGGVGGKGLRSFFRTACLPPLPIKMTSSCLGLKSISHSLSEEIFMLSVKSQRRQRIYFSSRIHKPSVPQRSRYSMLPSSFTFSSFLPCVRSNTRHLLLLFFPFLPNPFLPLGPRGAFAPSWIPTPSHAFLCTYEVVVPATALFCPYKRQRSRDEQASHPHGGELAF